MPYDETPQPVRRNFVRNTARVRRDPGVTYDLYFVPEFPLHLLRNKGIDEIKTEKFRQGRLLLLADIRERGMLNPLIVWNHTQDPHSAFKKDYPLPWYLKLGLNRRWCLTELGYTYAPSFVTMNGGLKPPFSHEKIEHNEQILRYWRDGTFVWHAQGPTGKAKAALDKYEFPEFDAAQAQILR
jgi:hypothetical protein